MNFKEYKKEKNKLITKLNRVKEFLARDEIQEEFNFSNLSKKMDRNIKYLEEDELRIVIVGSYSAGKTTFMKALLDFEHLPESHGENTASLAYFRKATEDNPDHTVKIELIEETIVILKKIDFEKINLFIETPGDDDNAINRLEEVEELLPDEAKPFFKENGNKFDPAHHVKSVDIWLDNELLNNDIVLIDSPGIGSISQKHERITKEEIERADAVIYLFNQDQLGGTTDQKFIGDILRKTKNIVFTINKADKLETDLGNEESWDTIINNLKDGYDKSPIIDSSYSFPEIIPFSAYYAWTAINKDEKELQKINENLGRHGKDIYENLDELFEKSKFDKVKDKLAEISTTLIEKQGDDEERKSKLDKYNEIFEKQLNEINGKIKKRIDELEKVEDSNPEEEIKKYKILIEKIERKNPKITDDLFKEKQGNYINWFIDRKEKDGKKLLSEFGKITIDIIDTKTSIDEIIINLERTYNNSLNSYTLKLKEVLELIGEELNKDYCFDDSDSFDGINIEHPVFDYDTDAFNEIENNIKKLEVEKEKLIKRIDSKKDKIGLNKEESNRVKGYVKNLENRINNLEKNLNNLGTRPKSTIINKSEPIFKKTSSEFFFGIYVSNDVKHVGNKTLQELDDSAGQAHDRRCEKINIDINENYNNIENKTKKNAEYYRIEKNLNEEIEILLKEMKDLNNSLIEEQNKKAHKENDEKTKNFKILKNTIRQQVIIQFDNWVKDFNPSIIDSKFKTQFEFLQKEEEKRKNEIIKKYEDAIKDLESQKQLDESEKNDKIDKLKEYKEDILKCLAFLKISK